MTDTPQTVPTLAMTPHGVSGPRVQASDFVSASINPQAMQNIKEALRDNSTQPSPLIHACSELLALCSSIDRINEIGDANIVRAEIARSIIDLKYAIVALDYPPSVAENLCLLFSIVIDEFVLSTTWGNKSGWENLTLVADLFGFRDGGDRFYNIAEQALMQPKALNEFLQITYIFLKIGYRGRYAVGLEQERDRFIHRIEQALQHPPAQNLSEFFGRKVIQTHPPRKVLSTPYKIYMAIGFIILINVAVTMFRLTNEKTAEETLATLRSQTQQTGQITYIYSSDTRKTVIRHD